MSQSTVREIYLRVINTTIESARTEIATGGPDDPTLAKLQRLKDHWTERLLAAQDFTDDPALVPRHSSGGARAASRSTARGPAMPRSALTRPPPPPRPAPRAATSASVPALPPLEPNVYAKTEFAPIPAVGSVGPAKSEPVLPSVANLTGASSSATLPSRGGYLPQGDAPGDTTGAAASRAPTGGEPPSKRARRQVDEDEESINGGENLDSSGDSDICSAGSDPDADNYILAQHDRVRKGTGKWKVQLKEGIAHINGRDYLFNRATCDLDW